MVLIKLFHFPFSYESRTSEMSEERVSYFPSRYKGAGNGRKERKWCQSLVDWWGRREKKKIFRRNWDGIRKDDDEWIPRMEGGRYDLLEKKLNWKQLSALIQLIVIHQVNFHFTLLPCLWKWMQSTSLCVWWSHHLSLVSLLICVLRHKTFIRIPVKVWSTAN